MQLFCQAVIEYDKMLEIAPTHFNEAQIMLEEAKIKAGELNNQPLVNNCREALNKLKSYQQIADLMLQEPKVVEELSMEPSPSIAEKPEEKPIETPKVVEEVPVEPSPRIAEKPEEKPVETPKVVEEVLVEPSPRIAEKPVETLKVVEEVPVEPSPRIDEKPEEE
jgi:septum formation inhibitor MinC